MKKIGVLQGAISNQKTFPYKNWKNEFWLAKQYDFDFVEWLVDSDPISSINNPFLFPDIEHQIRATSKETRMPIKSVYMKFYEEFPIIKCTNPMLLQNRIHLLKFATRQAKKLKINSLVLPMIKEGAIEKEIDIINLCFALKSLKPYVAKNTYVYLLTTLEQEDFNILLKSLKSIDFSFVKGDHCLDNGDYDNHNKKICSL